MLEEPKRGVAGDAEQATHAAGLVAVIDRQLADPPCLAVDEASLRPSADCADVRLRGEEALVLAEPDPEVSLQTRIADPLTVSLAVLSLQLLRSLRILTSPLRGVLLTGASISLAPLRKDAFGIGCEPRSVPRSPPRSMRVWVLQAACSCSLKIGRALLRRELSPRLAHLRCSEL